MRFTEEQASHLAHKALDAIRDCGLSIANDRLALNTIKKTLSRELDTDTARHAKVARKLASLGRNVPEGSAEYEILYRQYDEEERQRSRR